MENLLNFFNINNIFFTILGYPMSYLEFFGTLFTLWSVYLISKNKILNWPVGIIGIILFIILFYQIQLYSDFFEQIYFLITSFYGWWLWSVKGKSNEQKDKLVISRSSNKILIFTIFSILVGTILMGFIIARIHLFIPALFQEPATFPYLDSFTTVMSFAATILMIYRKIESWIIWIIVDIIGIWLYFIKDVKLISLLYVIFLILAINGLITWIKLYKKNE